MPESDHDARRPTEADLATMWRELEVQPVLIDDRAISSMCQAIQETHVNGGSVLRCFHVLPHAVFDWFAAHGCLEPALAGFFNLPVVSEAVPELMANARDPEFTMSWALPFTLEGELAAVLVHGGAYEKFRGPAREAKRMAQSFCHAIFQDRYDDVLVYRSTKPWSDWFHDIAWDLTYAIFDKRDRRLWLLAITDVD